ncbi:hypothetical protein LENED_007132 [Lentinula edodes]|uniref:Uncharacterized protein n=1 Tax=Lentinula edodes TaxID=5353 RepID=A0A1Q3EDJ5_LENED|nr:hypothetical protein LENED_007132 [Lentinula edodes]
MNSALCGISTSDDSDYSDHTVTLTVFRSHLTKLTPEDHLQETIWHTLRQTRINALMRYSEPTMQTKA